MLNIKYPSLIVVPLFHFMPPVASCCRCFVGRGCIGIENLHIEECAGSALVPKLLGLYTYVQPCLVLNIHACQGKPLPSQRLEGWLNGHIRANLGEELNSDIPNAVMPD